MGNNRGSRVTAVPALMYCTVLHDKEILEAVVRHVTGMEKE